MKFGDRSAEVATEKVDYIANMRKMEGLYQALAKSGHRA
jgi:hypothetical protein